MNKFKNEKLFKIGSLEILCRPTFENMQAFETYVVNLNKLQWNVFTAGKDGKKMAEALLTTTQAALSLFHLQAEKKFTLDQIWDACLEHGPTKVVADVTPYCLLLGSKEIDADKLKEISEEEKKN